MALRQVMVVSAAGGAKPARAAAAPKTAKPAPAKGNTLPPALQKPGVGGTVKRKPVAPKPTKQRPAQPKRSTPDLPWWLRDDVAAELKPLQATVAGLLSPLTAFLREQQRARARILLATALEGCERAACAVALRRKSRIADPAARPQDRARPACGRGRARSGRAGR